MALRDALLHPASQAALGSQGVAGRPLFGKGGSWGPGSLQDFKATAHV